MSKVKTYLFSRYVEIILFLTIRDYLTYKIIDEITIIPQKILKQ